MVDVFGTSGFDGNPVAVVLGGDGLSAEDMLRITRWFNLSETVFVLPATSPEADYRARIFTPDRELPFAGHPTLGACHVWLETSAGSGKGTGTPDDGRHHNGAVPAAGDFVQECGAGLVRLRRSDSGVLSFAAPPLLREGPTTSEELDEAARFLGISTDDIIDSAWIDNGPGWLGIRLASADEVLALLPAASWPRVLDIGVVGPHAAHDEDIDFEVRALFSTESGAVVEDPVTGSLNASVAGWLRESGVVDGPYVAAQGTVLGRRGRVFASFDSDGNARIGGRTVTHATGPLTGL